MKKACVLFVFLQLFIACNDTPNERVAAIDRTQKIRNMKGFDLFVWKADGKTFYTLLPGTNRDKDSVEIYDPKVAVGWPAMKRRMDEIEAGQYVSIKRLRADSADVSKVQSYLEERKLIVSVR